MRETSSSHCPISHSPATTTETEVSSARACTPNLRRTGLCISQVEKTLTVFYTLLNHIHSFDNLGSYGKCAPNPELQRYKVVLMVKPVSLGHTGCITANFHTHFVRSLRPATNLSLISRHSNICSLQFIQQPPSTSTMPSTSWTRGTEPQK